MTPEELAHYEAQIRRQELDWRARFEAFLHSDRIAADIGVAALRTAVLVNAGALVAMLPLISQHLADKDHHDAFAKIIGSARWFVGGLVCAAIAFAVAYFYQSAVTSMEQIHLREISQPLGPPPRIRLVAWITAVTGLVMVALALASLGTFGWGALSVLDTVKGL